jgi:hypothetical protein
MKNIKLPKKYQFTLLRNGFGARFYGHPQIALSTASREGAL